MNQIISIRNQFLVIWTDLWLSSAVPSDLEWFFHCLNSFLKIFTAVISRSSSLIDNRYLNLVLVTSRPWDSCTNSASWAISISEMRVRANLDSCLSRTYRDKTSVVCVFACTFSQLSSRNKKLLPTCCFVSNHWPPPWDPNKSGKPSVADPSSSSETKQEKKETKKQSTKVSFWIS